MIRRDHDYLKCIHSLPGVIGHFARRQLGLSKLYSDALHCDGVKHQTPDAHSRLTITEEEHAPIKDYLPVAVFESTSNSEAGI